MDPTAAEVAAMTTVRAALDWAGLRGDAADIGTPRGAFLRAFDLVEDDPPRVIAIMSEADFSAVTKGLRVCEQAPTPAVLAKAALVGRACRVVCGVATSSGTSALSAPSATIEVGASARPNADANEVSATGIVAPTSNSDGTEVSIGAGAVGDLDCRASPIELSAPVEGEGKTDSACASASAEAVSSSGADMDVDDFRPGLGFGGTSVVESNVSASAHRVEPPGDASAQGVRKDPGLDEARSGLGFVRASASSDASPVAAYDASPAAEPALSPAELERKKLLAFEEKLNKLSAQESAGRQDADKKAPVVDPSEHVDAAEVNGRSVYVGGLDNATTPDELQNFFKSCGTIFRVTILLDRLTGLPKGFAYIEFREVLGVQNAMLLNGGVFNDRQIKVVQKQTNTLKGKGKDKSKGKDKGKGKGKDKDKGKGKASGNMVWRPNQSAPY